MDAIRGCNKNNVQLLLNYGANPNVTDDKKRTILHHLAYGYDVPETVEYIIDKGGDVNAADHFGASVIYTSSSANHPKTAKKLLELNADPFKETLLNYNAFDDAAFDLLGMYIDRQRANGNGIIASEIRQKTEKQATKQLTKLINYNYTDEDFPEQVKRNTDYGADLSIMDTVDHLMLMNSAIKYVKHFMSDRCKRKNAKRIRENPDPFSCIWLIIFSCIVSAPAV